MVKLGIFPNFNVNLVLKCFFIEFVSPLRPKTIDDGFVKPFRIKISTTDLLSPYGKKFDPVLVTCEWVRPRLLCPYSAPAYFRQICQPLTAKNHRRRIC